MTNEQDKFGKIEIRAEGEGAVTKTELPLRILFIGDFVPDAPESRDWESSSRIMSITPGTFQSVMEELKPHISINVPNCLNDTPEQLSFELNFANMQAFRPGEIAQQIDELSSLLKLRGLVKKLNDKEINLQEFEEKFAETGIGPAWLEGFKKLISTPQEQPTEPTPQETPSSKPGEDALNSLLDMVDTSQEKKSPSEAKQVDDLIRTVIGAKKSEPKADKSATENVLDELDNSLNAQVNAILHHEKFQQIESAWRGLRFLMERIDFRNNIILEILPAHKSELRDAIYHQVFTPEYNEANENPLSIMVADYDFDRSTEDVELLWDIARISDSINVPFIASVGPEFFGLQTAAEYARLPMLNAHFQREEYAQWNALRDDEVSQYIALVVSRFLLRYPYGPDGLKIKEFDFVEDIRSSKDYLWGRGAFILVAAIVKSFADDGWCVNITGSQGGGMIENLPMRKYRIAARDIQTPLEFLVIEKREREFTGNGLVILSSRINVDRAYILAAPTINRPKQYTTAEENMEAYLHSTLPYGMFATRMAHYLQSIAKEVSAGQGASQIQAVFTSKLRSALAKTGEELPIDAVVVQVTDDNEKPCNFNVVMRIIPPFQILGQDVSLLLGLQV